MLALACWAVLKTLFEFYLSLHFENVEEAGNFRYLEEYFFQ